MDWGMKRTAVGWICRENKYTCKETRVNIWLDLGGFVDPAWLRSLGLGNGF